jgi:sulfate permease, SulP family
VVSATPAQEVARSGLRTIAAIASAGVLIGSISLVSSLSYAAIIYSGPLAPYLSQGIGLTLIGAVVMSVVGALTLSYRGSICQAQDVPAILLAVAAAALAGPDGLEPQTAFATVVVLVGLSTVGTGVVAYGMGRMRLGYLVRYVPLPVISGFLAATGVLLIRAGFDMAAPGAPSGAAGLAAHLWEQWPRWLPWLTLAAVIAILVRKTSNGLIVPAGLLIATIGFYVALPLLSLDLSAARSAGLLLGPFDTETFIGDIDPGLLRHADWASLLVQTPMVLVIVGMAILGTLLNASGLELATRREIDLDRDLRGVGVANMAAGLGGGMVGYHLLGASLLARRIGIGGIGAGFSVAAVCAAAVFFGAGTLSNLPLGRLAAVIWFLGFDLLLTALHEHGWRMPWREFALVIITPAIALAFGFLPAVVFGVLVACLLFIAAYASVDVVRLSTTGATFRARIERSPQDFRRLGEMGRDVHIYKLSGFLFFGSAHKLVERIRQRREAISPHGIIVVDLEKVVGIDMSALAAFERLARRFREEGVRFILTGLSPRLSERYKSWTRGDESHETISESFDDVLQGIEEQLLSQDAAGHAPRTTLLEVMGGPHRDVGAALEEYGDAMRLAAGDLVLREGAPADHLIVLLSGRLKVTVTNSNGLTVTINRLLPGAILGEVGYYANVPRTATVVAETPALALRITAEALSRMEREAPSQAAAFHRTLAGVLARRLMHSTQLLKDAEV